MVTVDIYVIIESRNGHPAYITCFINRILAEQYVYEHPKCYIKHETKDSK